MVEENSNKVRKKGSARSGIHWREREGIRVYPSRVKAATLQPGGKEND